MPRFTPHPTAPVPERAVLVGVERRESDWPIGESMAELARLAETDGAVVVATMVQRLDAPVPRTFIGSGKAGELVRMVHSLDADVVIFDDELTPSQQSNLERIVGEPTKVIDRTALILDIFGEHATTREGRLQVQLAQLQYLLPRLRGMWSHLVREQARGGIGSRFGQGESQLEVDRRLVRDRISCLRKELRRLEGRRKVQSKARWDSGVFRVALAGYTNAGKSTLLNRLTGAGAYVKDELFATLDPTTRSMVLDAGRKVTVTDTVGFIQKLPTTLVESFKSTLAEVMAADLVLLVADASDGNVRKEIAAVRRILGDISASETPTVVVFNKIDALDDEELALLRTGAPDAVPISALTGRGIPGLLYRIAEEAARGDEVITALVPYERGALLRQVHERCRVIREEYRPEGLLATVSADPRMREALAPYIEGAGQ
ncbi:GTP-binding protein HflX [Olsenella uli DSM 7084]|uniref:GTPase HflX n=1 Tax=Olsenella uli (strain ATCC 49627 / DSM 7084 / CCUG 31166 / CIP 109912 / JCM 12494 / LMG 11480 / NCIMB 702895 / VPI D76D-27C) TaxID=633147 RepID=E1R099_OLSUV|nr:GTPase HflX [Olsenella uli]ADK68063.1 GTP-binding protein HflX [Olsenella uli DSM 7084]MBS6418179.1 GTPase HflX [Olsenella uli]